MIIYLAELSHTGAGRSPNVVPLAAGYLAAYAKKNFPGAEIKIFRDPNLLLEQVKMTPPDVVGLSFYSWSERLSSFCAQRIKSISKETVVVAGGAAVDDISSELLNWMKMHPFIDVCIPNEGEISFVRLLEYLSANDRFLADEIIAGCARVSSEGHLLRGEYPKPDVRDLPSPYLGGDLDAFLADGYEPILQTMRGCPYLCTFCVSGTTLWNKLRAFELDRVFEEFNYIKKRTKSDLVILTDENLGILKERDVELSAYIAKSFQKDGFPERLYFYTAKIVTEHVLKVVENLAPICEFGMSLQTLDENVRREIKRTNLQYKAFLEYIKWAEQKNIQTSTEVIFGFPGETADYYLHGLERLLLSGVNRIYSYNLRLLSGIDLATEPSRERYNFKTKFRLPERTFGIYDDTIVTEVEEVVVGSNSFDFDDYQRVRKYGLFLELSSGRGYFSELIRLLVKLGLPGEKLLRFLVGHSMDKFPRMRSIVTDYAQRMTEELVDTPELCTQRVAQYLKQNVPVPEVKLNFIFTGKIMLDALARRELIAMVKEFIVLEAKADDQLQFFEDYIDNILSNQIVAFRPDEPLIFESQTRIRLNELANETYTSAEALMTKNPSTLRLVLHKDAKQFLDSRPFGDYLDEHNLQDIYMTVSRFGLMRECVH